MNANEYTVIECTEECLDALECTSYASTGFADEPAQDRDSHPAEPEWSPEEEQAHYEAWCHREAERVTRQLQAVAEEVVREASKPAPSHIDQAHAAALAEDRARQHGLRRSSSRTVSRFASSK